MADDKKRDASAGAISGKTGVTLVKYNPETGVMEAQRMKRKSPWEKFKENPLIPIGFHLFLLSFFPSFPLIHPFFFLKRWFGYLRCLGWWNVFSQER